MMRQVLGRKRVSIWRACASLVLFLTVSATAAQERRLDLGVEREIQEVNGLFFEALDRRDAGAAEGLLSEDYLAVLPGPRVITRDDQLAAIRQHTAAGSAQAVERTWRDVRVRVFGDTAVLTGLTTVKERHSSVSSQSLVTLLWVKQGGRWRVGHYQRSPLGVEGEADRWNEVFSRGSGFNAKPNALLVEATKALRPGQALDLGMGQGRNAIYLAERGWDVTGVDVAEVGLAQARARARELGTKLTLVLQDAAEFDYGRERWDLVAVIYFNPRPYAERIRAALKPGGVVVIEGFHRDATQGRRIGAGVVFDSGELRELFKGFEVLRYEEVEDVADYGLEKVRLVRLVARKK